jgi:hypothetical protein
MSNRGYSRTMPKMGATALGGLMMAGLLVPTSNASERYPTVKRYVDQYGQVHVVGVPLILPVVRRVAVAPVAIEVVTPVMVPVVAPKVVPIQIDSNPKRSLTMVNTTPPFPRDNRYR